MPYIQNKITGISKLLSLAACQHYWISGRDSFANLIHILSHVSDTWEVAVYWRTINIPLSYQWSSLTTTKKTYRTGRGEMLGSVIVSVLCCCAVMSFCPSGFAVCLSDSVEGMEGQQHLTNTCRRNPSSSFQVHEWNLLSSVVFCLTPTLLSSSGSILQQRVTLTRWQLTDTTFWLEVPPEVCHIWGVEGGKCKIWLSSSLSYGNAAVQSIFSTELKGASPPFEAGEHCRRVPLGWKGAWNTCAAWSIYKVCLLCIPLVLLFISV